MFKYLAMNVTNLTTAGSQEIIEVEVPETIILSIAEFIRSNWPQVFRINKAQQITDVYQINSVNGQGKYPNFTLCEYKRYPNDNSIYKMGPYFLNNKGLIIQKDASIVVDEFEDFLKVQKNKEEKQDLEESKLYDEILF